MIESKYADTPGVKKWDKPIPKTPEGKWLVPSNYLCCPTVAPMGRTVVMSPEQFLKFVPEAVIWHPKFYRDKFRKGEPVGPSYLKVDVETGKPLAHEGRHRAYAAWTMGIREIPVTIDYAKLNKEKGYYSNRNVDLYKDLPSFKRFVDKEGRLTPPIEEFRFEVKPVKRRIIEKFPDRIALKLRSFT